MPSTYSDRRTGISTSVAIKPPCVAVSSSNLTLSGLQTVGGVTVVDGNRVLLISQTDARENGIWNVSTGSWTRAEDFDGNRDAVCGTLVIVRNSVVAGAMYELTAADPVVIGTSLLTFVIKNDPSVTYDRTQAEIANSIIPVSFSYEPGNVFRNGYVGDGVTDDTVAIQSAAVNGVLIMPPSTPKITSEITLNHVLLALRGNVLFTGTGSIRGVITNDWIPHSAFQVKYNLVTASQRLPITVTGNYFLDPLLGSDSYSGLTAALALRTLSAMMTKIATVAASATSLTIVVRSGRHETSGITMDATHTLTSGGDVTWIENPGETAHFTAPTTWFFRSSDKVATYGSHASVANSLGYAFYDLYDAETGEQVECAHNMGPNYSMHRNGVDAIAAPSSSNINITLDSLDVTSFTAHTTAEKAGIRLRISHSFTSSWHDAPSLAGSVLTVSAAAAGQIYYDGWNFRQIDAFGAPYLMQNMKTALNGENFCAYTSGVYLPNKGTNYFTVDRSVNFLIKTGAAERHVFLGLSFRYLAMQTSRLLAMWTADPRVDCGFIVGGAGRNTIQYCKFAYGNANGVVLARSNATVTDNDFYMLGLCGIVYDHNYGADNCVVARNKVRRWGHMTSMASIGIWASGVNINVYRNDVRNGPWTAIRADSAAIMITPTGAPTGVIRRNFLTNIGMIDGVPCDYIATCDGGVITLYGGNSLGAFPAAYEVAENVVGPGWGYQYIRGIFGDDGITGTYVHDNLVWGHVWYALDFRQVGSSTYGNSVRNNLWLGTVNMQSATATSDFSGNIVAATVGNHIDSTPNIAIVSPNAYGIKCDTSGQVPIIDGQDPAITLPALAATPYLAMLPFVKSHLKLQSFVSSGPVYQDSAIKGAQLPITASTYTVGEHDRSLTFSAAGTCTITLPPVNTSAGRQLRVRTIAAQTVVASASVVCPLTTATPGTAILAATAGKWAELECDGGSWNVVMAN